MKNNCCVKNKNHKGILKGFIYGVLPHSFCLGFIVFSIIGSVWATAVFREFLMIPYFFQILVIISFLMATLSATLYLKKNDCLCARGIKSKWKYLAVLYGATILTNLFMFSYALPTLANININSGNVGVTAGRESISLTVEIPCLGHAPLIIYELKKNNGVENVIFTTPDIFEVRYNPDQISPEEILATEIFETYKAVLNKN